MGPMGEARRQLALGTTAGRKLSWGGIRYGCLDPEEPRIIPGATYLFTGFGDAFWCRMCRWSFFGGLELLPGRACVVLISVRRAGPACVTDLT